MGCSPSKNVDGSHHHHDHDHGGGCCEGGNSSGHDGDGEAEGLLGVAGRHHHDQHHTNTATDDDDDDDRRKDNKKRRVSAGDAKAEAEAEAEAKSSSKSHANRQEKRSGGRSGSDDNSGDGGLGLPHHHHDNPLTSGSGAATAFRRRILEPQDEADTSLQQRTEKKHRHHHGRTSTRNEQQQALQPLRQMLHVLGPTSSGGGGGGGGGGTTLPAVPSSGVAGGTALDSDTGANSCGIEGATSLPAFYHYPSSTEPLQWPLCSPPVHLPPPPKFTTGTTTTTTAVATSASNSSRPSLLAIVGGGGGVGEQPTSRSASSASSATTTSTLSSSSMTPTPTALAETRSSTGAVVGTLHSDSSSFCSDGALSPNSASRRRLHIDPSSSSSTIAIAATAGRGGRGGRPGGCGRGRSDGAGASPTTAAAPSAAGRVAVGEEAEQGRHIVSRNDDDDGGGGELRTQPHTTQRRHFTTTTTTRRYNTTAAATASRTIRNSASPSSDTSSSSTNISVGASLLPGPQGRTRSTVVAATLANTVVVGTSTDVEVSEAARTLQSGGDDDVFRSAASQQQRFSPVPLPLPSFDSIDESNDGDGAAGGDKRKLSTQRDAARNRETELIKGTTVFVVGDHQRGDSNRCGALLASSTENIAVEAQWKGDGDSSSIRGQQLRQVEEAVRGDAATLLQLLSPTGTTVTEDSSGLLLSPGEQVVGEASGEAESGGRRHRSARNVATTTTRLGGKASDDVDGGDVPAIEIPLVALPSGGGGDDDDDGSPGGAIPPTGGFARAQQHQQQKGKEMKINETTLPEKQRLSSWVAETAARAKVCNDPRTPQVRPHSHKSVTSKLQEITAGLIRMGVSVEPQRQSEHHQLKLHQTRKEDTTEATSHAQQHDRDGVTKPDEEVEGGYALDFKLSAHSGGGDGPGGEGDFTFSVPEETPRVSRQHHHLEHHDDRSGKAERHHHHRHHHEGGSHDAPSQHKAKVGGKEGGDVGVVHSMHLPHFSVRFHTAEENKNDNDDPPPMPTTATRND